ncbi:MAG: DUF2589 domain-containing protein [Magnetococcus sp. YQC-3]
MKPLPLKHLIGQPLRAVVEAHGMAAHATSEFIMKAGFTHPAVAELQQANLGMLRQDGTKAVGDPTQPGARARIFEFTYVHPVPDPANPGAVIHTPVKMQVPVLSLLQVPALGIAEATIEFCAHVKEAEQTLERRAIGMMAPASEDEYVMLATYAPKSDPAQQDPNAGSLSVSIKVTREPHAEGLAKIFGALQDAMTATPLQLNLMR